MLNSLHEAQYKLPRSVMALVRKSRIMNVDNHLENDCASSSWSCW